MSKTSSDSSQKPLPIRLLKGIWNHKLGRFAVYALIALIITFAVLAIFGITPAQTIAFFERSWDSLLTTLDRIPDKWAPFAIVLILLFLPSTPLPLTALLFASGIALKNTGMSTTNIAILIGSSMAGNVIWSYWLGAGPARNFVHWVLRRSSINLPTLTKNNALDLTLLMRTTPGIPYFSHALVLGFLRVPFLTYLLISLLAVVPLSIAVAVLGKEVAAGNLTMILIAVFAIVILIVGSRLMFNYLNKKKQARKEAHGKPAEIEAELIDNRPETDLPKSTAKVSKLSETNYSEATSTSNTNSATTTDDKQSSTDTSTSTSTTPLGSDDQNEQTNTASSTPVDTKADSSPTGNNPKDSTKKSAPSPGDRPKNP